MLLLATLTVSACKHIVPRSAVPQEVPAAAATTGAGTSAASALDRIVNGELQHGDYAQGEKALRQYLSRHPGDRPAQFMLHQLTDDPEHALGSASRPYVVRTGDTFGALAARYLGDANRFLILARYNGSTDPSQLAVGETIRLPTAVPGQPAPANPATPNPDATTAGAPANPPPPAAPALPSAPAQTTVTAAQLQAQSVALLDQGHKAQALARLDQALDMDPGLPPDGARAAALRKELLGNYHQRAVILYRDQHLDQAIALWNHVLAIDPHYEPAVIYRARARELKRRLQQLEKH